MRIPIGARGNGPLASGQEVKGLADQRFLGGEVPQSGELAVIVVEALDGLIDDGRDALVGQTLSD